MTTKRKASLKKWICTVSNFIDLIQFHLIWKILAKLSGVESEVKENSCAVFTNSIEWAREIRKFQVSDLQRRLKNVQKSMMHMQSCCFANLNRLLFCRSRCRRRRCCLSSALLWSRNVVTMLTWRHTSLIGLEQWYFSLIWNTYMWKLQTLCR